MIVIQPAQQSFPDSVMSSCIAAVITGAMVVYSVFVLVLSIPPLRRRSSRTCISLVGAAGDILSSSSISCSTVIFCVFSHWVIRDEKRAFPGVFCHLNRKRSLNCKGKSAAEHPVVLLSGCAHPPADEQITDHEVFLSCFR